MESCIGLASHDCFDQPQDVPAARCGICSLHPAQFGLFARDVIQRTRKHHEVVKSNKDIKFASRILGTMRASRSRGSSRLCGKRSGGPGVFAAEIAVRRKRWSLAHRAQLAEQQGMSGEAETGRGEGERGGGIAETRTTHKKCRSSKPSRAYVRGSLATATLARAAVARPDSTLDQNRPGSLHRPRESRQFSAFWPPRHLR